MTEYEDLLATNDSSPVIAPWYTVCMEAGVLYYIWGRSPSSHVDIENEWINLVFEWVDSLVFFVYFEFKIYD